MAITSVTGFPSLNAYKTDKASGNSAAAADVSSPATEDLVEISSAALERLESEKLASENKAGVVAKETASILEKTGVSLGLDPEFS